MTDDTNIKSDENVGYLMFSVDYADGTIPIEDAIVYVYTDPESGSGELLYSLKTNEDGLTEKIALPTPPLSESFSPDAPKPYSTYNIFAKKVGFYPTEGRVVPLFPGITSIQPINLVPLSEIAVPGQNRPGRDVGGANLD